MKRAIALLAALCLLGTSFALAEDAGATEKTVAQGNGLTVLSEKTTGQTDTLKFTVERPKFVSEDAELVAYLETTITEPLMALQKASPMLADASLYTADTLDYIRLSFTASLDFPGVLSLEATVVNRSADKTTNELLFFYRFIDLNQRKELTVYDLFSDPRETVDTAIRAGVFAVESAGGKALVTDVSQVPAPNSYAITGKSFMCLFAAGTVETDAVAVKVPWDQLALTPSPLLTGAEESEPVANAQPEAQETAIPQNDSAAMPADTTVSGDALLALLTAADWQTQGSTLRFEQDGTIADPTGASPIFTGYSLLDGKLYLDSTDRPEQGVTVSGNAQQLTFTFDPETSDYTTLILTATMQSEPAVDVAPVTNAPATEVPTPTPMPLTGDDADIAAFLAQGLWKRIGTDGNTYYQFTPDGKLLTIEVTPYTVENGALSSEVFSGEVVAGGTAFTVKTADGEQIGYVLNRSATAIPVEEFVTATPTPPPTPTPTLGPTPTPSPTPTPTPVPTPTLSPYEQAAQTAPTLAALGDAAFAKRQSFDVYSAPDKQSYRDPNAKVTTDDQVSIYGVAGDWVLVSYKIGNGSRGRVGYIANDTLADPDNVAQLAFANIPLKLTKKVKATDDPLNGKGKLFDLNKDASVTLLAFMGSDWAYVETTYKNKTCRVFISRSALMEE